LDIARCFGEVEQSVGCTTKPILKGFPCRTTFIAQSKAVFSMATNLLDDQYFLKRFERRAGGNDLVCQDESQVGKGLHRHATGP
jgi:hypothetical protein